MPIGLISLQSVWEKILETGEELKIAVSKAGIYATLDELDDILGDIEWLWPGWIPKGFVTMVAGDPGIGKSALVQHLVKIITSGGCFPLEEKSFGKSGEAVWVDTEASQQILKVRAGSMGIDKKRVYLPIINGDLLSQANLGSDEDRRQIIDLVEGVEPTVLVLDSLGGSHSRGENKVEDIRPVLEFLALLARDYKLAVIVVHHLNKGKEGESPEVSLYRIRGSTVIPAYCRSIIAIEPSVEKKLKIRLVKTNLARIGDPISVIPLLDELGEFTGFDYEPYAAPPKKKNKKEICSEWVYDKLLKEKGGMELTELIKLGEVVGYTRANISSAKELLGERISFSGTGNKSFWHISREDKASMKKIMNNNGRSNANASS